MSIALKREEYEQLVEDSGLGRMPHDIMDTEFERMIRFEAEQEISLARHLEFVKSLGSRTEAEREQLAHRSARWRQRVRQWEKEQVEKFVSQQDQSTRILKFHFFRSRLLKRMQNMEENSVMLR